MEAREKTYARVTFKYTAGRWGKVVDGKRKVVPTNDYFSTLTWDLEYYDRHQLPAIISDILERTYGSHKAPYCVRDIQVYDLAE